MRQKHKTIVNNKVSKSKKCAQARVKSAKKDDTHHIVEDYEILDGAAKIIRTTKSGKFWSMSCWLREEGKCYRKSLRTKNKEEAMELAREQYFQLKANVRAGIKIYSITAKELVEKFVEHKEDEAKSGIISEGRATAIRISLNKWFISFVGTNTKLDKISRHDFENYYIWRRQKAENVRNATLINERALISSLFKFGIQRGFLRAEQTAIFPRLNVKKSQVERRDALEVEEWEKMYRSFRRWVSKAESKKEEEQRKFIRDFIILSINAGLRFGEMRKLTWRMIKIYKSKTQKNKRGEAEFHAEISVPEDTKTGARTATALRGDIFERIRGYSKHKKANDWIFVDNETGGQIHKKVYYKQWQKLLKECGLQESGKSLSYYSLRHSYITYRLINGVNAFFLAKNVGTSVRMIENHYEHIKSEAMKYELTKKMRQDEAGRLLAD